MFKKDTIMCKDCLWRTLDSFGWIRINFKQSTDNLIYEKLEKSFQHQADIGRRLNPISINHSEEEHTHFEDLLV